MTELSRIQRLKLRIFGFVSVGFRTKRGWRSSIEHYAFKCQKHGLIVDYPHSHKQRLQCPQCIKEKLKHG